MKTLAAILVALSPLRAQLPLPNAAGTSAGHDIFAFHDIHPQAPVHVLVIPKGAYVSMDDFSSKASGDEIAGFFRAVGEVARKLGLPPKGYRILANHGRDGGQEVPHFHIHIFGGRPLGRMIAAG